MTEVTSGRVVRWARGVGLVAVAALVSSVLVPENVFWTGAVAAGLIGAAVATAILVRVRSIPTLAQVIATAESAPVVPVLAEDAAEPRSARKG
jgi:hypothetical protein